MKYVKLNGNNVVIQVQPEHEEGFIEAPDNVVAGMIKNGNTYAAPSKTTEEQTQEIIKSKALELKKYWEALEIKMPSGRRFKAHERNINIMRDLAKAINKDMTVVWTEPWSYNNDGEILPLYAETPVIELDEVVIEATKLIQEKQKQIQGLSNE